MDEYRTQLQNAIEEIVGILLRSSNAEDLDLCSVRLESYAENALLQDNIPLEIVDLLSKAANILKDKVTAERRFASYKAPVERRETRGRPKFLISEEQLAFFKGNYHRAKFQLRNINISISHRMIKRLVYFS